MNYGINVEIINEYIKANNLSKTEFCKQCKISASTFYRLMQGKDNLYKFFIKSSKKIARSVMSTFSLKSAAFLRSAIIK